MLHPHVEQRHLLPDEALLPRQPVAQQHQMHRARASRLREELAWFVGLHGSAARSTSCAAVPSAAAPAAWTACARESGVGPPGAAAA